MEDGYLRVYVVSDKTAPSSAELRVRLMTLDGATLSDTTETVQVPELSSKVYVQRPLSEFANAKGADAAGMFAVTSLIVDGKPVSSNVVYFVAAKEVHLPAAQIDAELSNTEESGTYRLRLSSKVLARSVYVSFGDANGQPSDNYFDLIPGEAVEISVKSAVPVEQLRTKLKVVSLADAFAPAGAEVQK